MYLISPNKRRDVPLVRDLTLMHNESHFRFDDDNNDDDNNDDDVYDDEEETEWACWKHLRPTNDRVFPTSIYWRLSFHHMFHMLIMHVDNALG